MVQILFLQESHFISHCFDIENFSVVKFCISDELLIYFCDRTMICVYRDRCAKYFTRLRSAKRDSFVIVL